MKTKNALFCLASGSVTIEVIEFAISLSHWGFTIYGNEAFVGAVKRLNNCVKVRPAENIKKASTVSIVVADCNDLSCSNETDPYRKEGIFIVPSELLTGNSFFNHLLVTIAIGDESEMVQTGELIDAPEAVLSILKQAEVGCW